MLNKILLGLLEDSAVKFKVGERVVYTEVDPEEIRAKPTEYMGVIEAELEADFYSVKWDSGRVSIVSGDVLRLEE